MSERKLNPAEFAQFMAAKNPAEVTSPRTFYTVPSKAAVDQAIRERVEAITDKQAGYLVGDWRGQYAPWREALVRLLGAGAPTPQDAPPT